VEDTRQKCSAHNPDHKAVCRMNIMRKRARVKSVANAVRGSPSYSTTSTTFDPAKVVSTLKTWSQMHRNSLTLAALQGLQLFEHPENITKYILWLELKLSSNS
jgi:hypothetical protein